MNPLDFFELSLATQVALGAGFLAYALAYAGLREGHGTVDVVFITLAFAALASLTFGGGMAAGFAPFWASLGALSITLMVAALWRRWARGWCLWLLSVARVHREDGAHRGWAVLVQSDCVVSQASVHLKDGRTLYLNDRQKYLSAPWQGLYLGGDGSVILVVEEEERADGTEEARQGISDADHGARMTYVPAAEVVQVNLRMKQ